MVESVFIYLFIYLHVMLLYGSTAVKLRGKVKKKLRLLNAGRLLVIQGPLSVGSHSLNQWTGTKLKGTVRPKLEFSLFS